MCKVLIMPSIKKHKMNETVAFIKAMGEKMTANNNDGLGYASVNERGELFGERWFVNNEAFKPQPKDTGPDYSGQLEVANKSVEQLKGMLKGKPSPWSKPIEAPKYNSFGKGSITDIAAITLHTRFATCDKGLHNVHPFVDAALDTSVIHNGVISNHKDFTLTRSTCDSESILISYLEERVFQDINNMQKAVERLRGYYACGVFSRDASGRRILDVFKLNNNNLCVAYIFELETYVFTTSEYDLKQVCSSLGFTHNGIQDLNDGVITRIDPITGEVIEQASFNSPTVTQNYGNYYNRPYTPSYEGATVYNRAKSFSNQISPARARMLALPSRLVEKSQREVEETIETNWRD